MPPDAIFGVFVFLIWLGILIFVFRMIYRLVKAVERIAESSDCNNIVLKDIVQTLKNKDNE